MLRTHWTVAAAFLLLTVGMTWPLAFAFDRAVSDPGDPYINTWILDWDYHATLHQPLHLFDADVFYPARHALAFSENLYGIALILFPFRLAGVGPIGAHNVAMIIGFAFSGFAAYLLTFHLTRSVGGAIAAGIFYAFVPFRFTQLPHVQHVFAGWLPLLTLALICYGERPTWKRAALFGGAFLMNGLTNIHWLLFGALAIAFSVPFVVAPRDWPRLLAATALAAALLAPFLIPYAEAARDYGMVRTAREAMAASAQLHDWLNPGVANRFYRRFADRARNPECWLFPGVLALVFALIGLRDASRSRRLLAVALLWIAIGFLGSLGLHTFFHRFLFAHVPGFRAIRVPARWANIAYLGLSMLVASGAAATRRLGRALPLLVAAAFVVELHAAPIRWYVTSPTPPGVYSWLKTSDAVVAELPIATADSEYRAMRWSTLHHRPIINGVSGFTPPESQKLQSLWRSSPRLPTFLDELRAVGVTHVVVHGDWFTPDDRTWLAAEVHARRLGFVGRFSDSARLGGDWLFRLGGGDGSSSPLLDRFLAGNATNNPGTFGVLDPSAGGTVPGRARFSGWALSPFGVRKVDLLFENGQVRIPTELVGDRMVSRTYPSYGSAGRPRFQASFERRPRNIRRETDVQVEITDGRGEKTLLEDEWIEWK
jgi:hypothetical protein